MPAKRDETRDADGHDEERESHLRIESRRQYQKSSAISMRKQGHSQDAYNRTQIFHTS